MKALKTLALALALLLTLSACGATRGGGPAETEGGSAPAEEPASQPAPEEPEDEPPAIEDVSLSIGALKGPTAMGMIRMISDDGVHRYTLAGSADELTPALIKGDLDIACVPANLAAVLYIVENGGETVRSMGDLKGKPIVAAGKGSTPEYGLRYLLEQNGLDPDKDVSVDWKSEHAECVAALAAGAADIALLPQPFVTVAQGKLENLRVALDLTAGWDALGNGSAMITGVAVARRALAEENPKLVGAFLEDYAASVDWVNANPKEAGELVSANGIIENPAVAEKALPHCNIVCLTGEEMTAKLSGYLQVLAEANPQSVGGALPGDDFYYGV